MINIVRGLSNFCLENNLHLIDHVSTMNTRHVSGAKLHLNKKRYKDFVQQFQRSHT